MTKKKPKPLTGKAGDFSGIVLKAAARGDETAVRFYLKHNSAWLNHEGPHGRTLLWEAAYKGRTSLVAKLIEWGADVSPLGSYYTPMLVELTPLAVAREAGRTELVELLIRHGAEDDLYAACHRGDLEAMDGFLSKDHGAVNRPARDEPPSPRMGYLPIHYAVAGKQLGAIRLLVGHGAEITQHLKLLLDWADGNSEIIHYLRDQANRIDPESVRLIDRVDKEFVDMPAIDRPDWMGFPPLVDACRGNHNATDDPKRVKRILDQGASVNVTDHKGKSPLHRASQAGFVAITQLLLTQGAELELVDANGGTPIFDAAHHGRTPTVELLINAGANIHHTESRGETILFMAARGHHVETFAFLMEAGCNLDHKNKRGKTVEEMIRSGRRISAGRQKILDIIGRS